MWSLLDCSVQIRKAVALWVSRHCPWFTTTISTSEEFQQLTSLSHLQRHFGCLLSKFVLSLSRTELFLIYFWVCTHTVHTQVVCNCPPPQHRAPHSSWVCYSHWVPRTRLCRLGEEVLPSTKYQRCWFRLSGLPLWQYINLHVCTVWGVTVLGGCDHPVVKCSWKRMIEITDPGLWSVEKIQNFYYAAPWFSEMYNFLKYVDIQTYYAQPLLADGSFSCLF